MLTGFEIMGNAHVSLCRAACPAMCSQRHQRASFTMPAAHDLAERFAAYTD